MIFNGFEGCRHSIGFQNEVLEALEADLDAGLVTCCFWERFFCGVDGGREGDWLVALKSCK